MKLAALMLGTTLGLLAPVTGSRADDAPPSPAPARAKVEASSLKTVWGLADASAAVLVHQHLLLAGDEDNCFWLLHPTKHDRVQRVDLDAWFKKHRLTDEADLEAAARVNDRVYWIGSHGRDKKGRYRPARHLLFAVRVTKRDASIQVKPVGSPYRKLLDDLLADDRLKTYQLKEASLRSAKKPGGLNIEALASDPKGHLWVGFRGPLAGSKALLVSITNPDDVVMGKSRAKLGRIVEIDAGGRGFRSLDYSQHHQRFFALMGPTLTKGTFQLVQLDPAFDRPPALLHEFKEGLNPEALTQGPQSPEHWYVLSDDGSRVVEGRAGKDHPQAKQRFRLLPVVLDKPVATAPLGR